MLEQIPDHKRQSDAPHSTPSSTSINLSTPRRDSQQAQTEYLPPSTSQPLFSSPSSYPSTPPPAPISTSSHALVSLSKYDVLDPLFKHKRSEDVQRAFRYNRDIARSIQDAHRRLLAFESHTMPLAADVMSRVESHVVRVNALREGLMKVFLTLRKLRKKLIDSGVPVPEEEDPVAAIEREAEEEFEVRKREFNRRLEEKQNQQQVSHGNQSGAVDHSVYNEPSPNVLIPPHATVASEAAMPSKELVSQVGESCVSTDRSGEGATDGGKSRQEAPNKTDQGDITQVGTSLMATLIPDHDPKVS